MFSTPSQYTNYKIRGKSRHLHYPYYGLYNLSYFVLMSKATVVTSSPDTCLSRPQKDFPV